MFQSFICLPFFLLLRIERKRILHPPDLILQLRFPALIGCGSFPALLLHLPSKCFQTALFFQYPFFLFHKLQMVLSGGKLLDCILFQSPRLFLEPPAFLRQLMQKYKQFRSICPVPLFQRLPSFFPLQAAASSVLGTVTCRMTSSHRVLLSSSLPYSVRSASRSFCWILP